MSTFTSKKMKEAIEDVFCQVTGMSGGLDTLQVLSVDPIKVNNLQWRVVSRNIEKFDSAVRSFTAYNPISAEAERSLAFDTYDDGPYWYDEWGEKKLCSASDYTEEREFIEKDFGAISSTTSDNHLKKKLEFWIRSLEISYHGSGSCIWVTQRHNFRKFDHPIVTSVFCVFKHHIERTEKRYQIARLLRDLLTQMIIDMLEYQIESQYRIMDHRLRDYFSSDPENRIISEETQRQTDWLRPIVNSGLPIVVEGARGTGKLTTARYLHTISTQCSDTGRFTIHNGRKEIERSNINLSLKVLNSHFLRGSREESQLYLKSEGLINNDGKPADISRSTVVFDDIQHASPPAQFMLFELIEHRMSMNAIELSEDGQRGIIVTIAPDIETNRRMDKLIPELEVLFTLFRIRLQTIHERFAAIPQQERLPKFRELVEHFTARANNMRPLSPPISVPDQQVQAWLEEEAWELNYTELRQVILRYVVEQWGQTGRE